jgi:2-polyprenyl-3-methyl-5-hydroxy-6-metoxy-1,4-benzoquinol methylase
MGIPAAIANMRATFPVPDRLRPHDSHYRFIAETVVRHLAPGSRILDFGSGGCDKTVILATLGFRCSAYDDLGDPWHQEDDNRAKIAAFAAENGVALTIADSETWPYDPRTFDMVMCHNVLEHLHESPRNLLHELLATVRDDGYLFITVPNAANLRKRIDVMRGKTNYPPFEDFYRSTGMWRGHVREYTRGDLEQLAQFLPVTVVELSSYHHMLWKLPRRAVPIYSFVTSVFPSLRDSWMLVARVNRRD